LDAPAQILLQDALDASEIIGRWEYDVRSDRAYTDALVALVFNLDPIAAEAGAPLKAFLAAIHPDDRERASQTIAQSVATGLSCTLEYRVCSADGVTRWVLDRGRFTHDREGRPTRGTGILIDITHMKQEPPTSAPTAPLERAAEHCLAVREAVYETPHSLLHQMTDMLLLEIGRQLSRSDGSERRGKAN
jgi:hypothetical protein